MVKPRTRESLILGAFFEENEFRALLSAKGAHSPEEIERLVGGWRAGREALLKSPEWSPQVQVEPAPTELSEHIGKLKESDTFRGTVENLRHEVVLLSLPEVAAFQFTVDTSYATNLNLSTTPSAAEIAAVTIPTSGREFPIQVSGDPTGVTISAPGPNLRISGMALESRPSGLPRMIVDLTFGSPLMQVAEFNGRFMLKNGYHRAVGLLTRGITQVPVVLVHCNQYPETGAAGPGFFAPHVIMGAKPPLLKHYLSEYASKFDALDLRKAIRLRPDEFHLSLPE